MLFQDWYPVTHDIGFIEASPEDVEAAFVEWQASLGIVYSASSLPNFQQALESLQPLSAEMRRTLVAPTESRWSAFFRSGIAGSDPASAMPVLAGRMGVRTMRICATPPSHPWSACIWELWVPKGPSGAASQRSLAAVNDGGKWTFQSFGAPFSFEEVSSYVLPKKRDRFTPRHLMAYAAEFGLEPFVDHFYPVSVEQPARLLQRSTDWARPAPSYSLAQVVAGNPWAAKP